MQECCCVNSLAPHFTILRKGDLQLELRLQPRQLLSLSLNPGKHRRESRCVDRMVMSERTSLPDSVTHPSSLMTCGWGLSVFISSSSDFKSRLSDSRAFAV